ncbi:hypothetical protein L2E82_28092 [Cichorium intybus]|uniref:Uncharacterized protein n=1 Tax=Cichorium intybus TaxID=13427 RepID=A0ACB9CUR4_CICIN|nr:hypothetical protein L2E82_28092 [Cichorium intybus]
MHEELLSKKNPSKHVQKKNKTNGGTFKDTFDLKGSNCNACHVMDDDGDDSMQDDGGNNMDSNWKAFTALPLWSTQFQKLDVMQPLITGRIFPQLRNVENNVDRSP